MKFAALSGRDGQHASRPARGGWIEILLTMSAGAWLKVPPRKGRVD